MSWEIFERTTAPRPAQQPAARASRNTLTFNAAALARFEEAGVRLGGQVGMALERPTKKVAIFPAARGWKMAKSGIVAFTSFALVVKPGLYRVDVRRVPLPSGEAAALIVDWSVNLDGGDRRLPKMASPDPPAESEAER